MASIAYYKMLPICHATFVGNSMGRPSWDSIRIETMRKGDELEAWLFIPPQLWILWQKIGENVSIGPYSIVEADTELDDGCRLANNVRICKGTRMGRDCEVESNAVIGGDPQYVGWDRTLKTGVLIGGTLCVP